MSDGKPNVLVGLPACSRIVLAIEEHDRAAGPDAKPRRFVSVGSRLFNAVCVELRTNGDTVGRLPFYCDRVLVEDCRMGDEDIRILSMTPLHTWKHGQIGGIAGEE